MPAARNGKICYQMLVQFIIILWSLSARESLASSCFSCGIGHCVIENDWNWKSMLFPFGTWARWNRPHAACTLHGDAPGADTGTGIIFCFPHEQRRMKNQFFVHRTAIHHSTFAHTQIVCFGGNLNFDQFFVVVGVRVSLLLQHAYLWSFFGRQNFN